MKSSSAIILLSGGLDCTSALAVALTKMDVKLALTFDYGQLAFNAENLAAKNICEFYGIEHKTLEIGWLKALIQKDIPTLSIHDLENKELLKNTAQKVWVPNRNALFINIAACFADTDEKLYDKIIIGANKEEAQTFSDNSEDFINSINKTLCYSTNSKVQVYAPLIDKNKQEILKLAIENNAPLDLIYSCYKGREFQCGECESCIRLRNALNSVDISTKKKLVLKYFKEE